MLPGRCFSVACQWFIGYSEWLSGCCFLVAKVICVVFSMLVVNRVFCMIARMLLCGC